MGRVHPLTITLIGGRKVRAVTIFNKGHSAIIVDDGCYLLMNRVQPDPDRDPRWVSSAWWFPEAVARIRDFPPNPADLKNYTVERPAESRVCKHLGSKGAVPEECPCRAACVCRREGNCGKPKLGLVK
jgi:hypothetical protein